MNKKPGRVVPYHIKVLPSPPLSFNLACLAGFKARHPDIPPAMDPEKRQCDVEQAAVVPPPPPTTTDDDEPPPYSVFSRGEKRLLVCIVGLAMLFSPLTANIYFPAMTQLQTDLAASEQQINLSITTYLVLQAVAPVLFGDLADSTGRRPAFLVMFAVYTVASAGLALQPQRGSLAALLALRAAQSLGCSAAVAVSYGVVADVGTAAERGGMVGAAMVAVNLGPALAPLVGGGILALAATSGGGTGGDGSRDGGGGGGGGSWRWIFWFLAMCGGAALSLVALALPETARGIVGNSAVIPRSPWRRPLVSVCCGIRIPAAARLAASAPDTPAGPNDPASTAAVAVAAARRRRLPNPLRSVRVLFYRDSSLVLLISGVFYMVYYCVQASIATLFKRIYGFDEAVVGACYVAIGAGVVLGGYLNGRLLDRNYKTTAHEAGIELDRKRGDDMSKFPIERARLRSMHILLVVHLVVLVGYGWVLEKELVRQPETSHTHHLPTPFFILTRAVSLKHVSIPLALQFVIGFLQTCIVQVCTPSACGPSAYPARPEAANSGEGPCTITDWEYTPGGHVPGEPQRGSCLRQHCAVRPFRWRHRCHGAAHGRDRAWVFLHHTRPFRDYMWDCGDSRAVEERHGMETP